MQRRDFLRAGLFTAAASIVLPKAEFVRKYFPVGIDLRTPPASMLQIVGTAGSLRNVRGFTWGLWDVSGHFHRFDNARLVEDVSCPPGMIYAVLT